jgi:hypothetical protein
MILFSIGLPDRFTHWCDELVTKLAETALGTIDCAPLNTLDELALHLMRSGAPHLVVGSRQPNGRLRTAFAETNLPFLLILNDARLAVADLMKNHGYDVVRAVRFIANSCSGLLQFTELPGALVVNADRKQEALTVGTAIATHFGLNLAPDVIHEVVEIHPMPLEDADGETEAWWQGLASEGQALITGALSTYNGFLENGVLGKSIWERGLFLIGDAPAESAIRAIDITGRPRCLLYGPYIALPAGSWEAKVVLGFSKEAAGSDFKVEVFADAPIAQTRVRPTGEEVIEASLEFVIEAGSEQIIQIRVFNERSAFDGRLGLGNVRIVPQKRSQHWDGKLLIELDLMSK